MATAPAEGAEALVPRELQANGSSASSDSVPDAAEWLPGGDQPRERSRVAPEAAARPAAELSGKAVQPVEPDAPNPIAAMAAEAESFAVESEAATASEPVLEPPSWVAAKQPEGPAPEPDAKPEPEAKPKPEPAAKPAPEAERRPPAAPEPKEVAEDRLSLSLAEFEELRGLGMSVTQAKRVIRYRDERNGFRTLDELDQVPGFPRSFLSGVKERVVP